MLLISFIAALAVSAASNPAEKNSEHLTYLENLLGEGLNMSIVNEVVEEEALGLGITAEQHFQHCFLIDKATMLKHKQQFDKGFIEFAEKIGNLSFKSVDTVMDELKEETPKIHAAFTWLFKEMISDLGQEASIFIVNLKATLIDTLYKHSNLVLSGRANRRAPMFGKAIKKIYDEYDALTNKAKIDLEKKTCMRTNYRIIDLTGDRKGTITELKRMFDNYIVAASFKP